MQNRFESNYVSRAALLTSVKNDVENAIARVISVAENGLHQSVAKGGADVCSATVELNPGEVIRITGFASLARPVSELEKGQVIRISGKTAGRVRFNQLVQQPYIVLSAISPVNDRQEELSDSL